MKMFAGALWLRLHLHPTTRRRGNKQAAQTYNHSNSVFLVTFPGSPLFIMSRGGVQISRLVLQVRTFSRDNDVFVTKKKGQEGSFVFTL